MPSFAYGAVLRIERQYTLHDIYGHMEKMRATGMNFVVIWPAVYWWEDKNSPEYPYATGRRILEFAEKIGMKVIMELAGQTPALEFVPGFLMKDEYYRLDLNGHCDDTNYMMNYNHPEVKELIRKQFSEIAATYKNYPALYGYDMWNETVFNSYDEHTLQLFREWLRSKYQTIERLNDAWDKAFDDWSQVGFRYQVLWSSVMPYVDLQLFKRGNIGMMLHEWRGIIRSVDDKHPVIADNVSSVTARDDLYSRSQNDWIPPANADEYGISLYHKRKAADPPHLRSQILAASYCAANGKRFWISELQTHHQSILSPQTAVGADELAIWNWEAVAHGAKGIIHWKWEPFTKGYQTFGRGLVDHAWKDTPRSEAAAEVARFIRANEEILWKVRPSKRRTAILFDKMSQIFSKSFSITGGDELPVGSLYVKSIEGLYKCLWDLNIPADFVTPEEILSGKANHYRAIFITNQFNVSDELAEALKAYSEKGGAIIIDGKFGEIGDDGILHKDIPGGLLNSAMKCRLLDIGPPESTMMMQWREQRAEIESFFEQRMMKAEPDAEILARFRDGSPAILRAQCGDGSIICIATMIWFGYGLGSCQEAPIFLEEVNREYGLRLDSVSDNHLKIASLSGENEKILLAFNHTDQAIAAEITLENLAEKTCTITDMRSGENINSTGIPPVFPLRISAMSTAILSIRE